MSYPRETWFTSMISIEIFFQLPFFVVAAHTLLQQKRSQPLNVTKVDDSSCNDVKRMNKNSESTKPPTNATTPPSTSAAITRNGHFRSLCLIYGSSTATTLVPILSCVAFDPETSLTEKCILFGFYLPYLFFPAWLVWIAFWNEDVFADSGGRGGVNGENKAKVF